MFQLSKYFQIIGLFFLFTTSVFTQVEVLPSNSVKIAENTTINSEDGTNTISISTNSNTTGPKRFFKFQSSGTTGQRKGINMNLSGNAGFTVGLDNKVFTNSTTKYGVWNNMNNMADVEYGVYNTLSSTKNTSSTFSKAGVYNVIFEHDATFSFGFNNFITGGTNSSGTYGTQNRIEVNDSSGDNYGSYNYIDVKPAVSGGSVRGVSSIVTGSGSPSSAYAIYGEIEGSVQGSTNSTNAASTLWAGYFKGGAGVYSDVGFLSGSDRDLKEEIKELKNALTKLKKLKPKTYKLKKDNGKGELNHGFIAQDVQEIFPGLVQLVPQPGESRIEVIRKEEIIKGEDGEEDIVIPEQTVIRQDMDGKPLLAMNYQGIIPIAVAAIQEQQVEIEDLKNKNNKSIDTHYKRIVQLEEELLETKNILEVTNKKYNDLFNHIETLLKCVDCNGLRDSGKTGQIQFEDKFRLYPNPAKGSITIEALEQTSGAYQIAITDNAGRQMMDHELSHNTLTPVDVSKLSSGLYNVSIIQDGQVIATESLMIVNQ